LDELAIVDPENLHPAARFVIGRGNLKRRDEVARLKSWICSKPFFTSCPVASARHSP
jgi:hypothetical protein